MKQGQMAGSVRVLHLVTSSVSTILMRGQLRYLAEKNFQVFFGCSPGADLAEFSRVEQVTTVTVSMVREVSLWRDFRSFFRLCGLLRRVRPAITNVGTPKAGLLGGLAAVVARVPCRVYTLRGLRWETTRGFQRALLLVAEWIACHCAHRVICVSQSLREKIEAAGLVGRSRTVVLGAGSSNGVDSTRFELTPERQARAIELRQRLAIPSAAPVIGYVGRLTHDKGIPELYEAYTILRSQFPLLRLLLVGDFESEDPLPPRVRAAIKSDPSVLQTGFVADVVDFYQVFDVLAFPTHREGFPNVILEAQAAGKPVVSTCATGVVDAVVDGLTGILVPVGDSQALAEALKTLLCDPDRRVKMGAEGQARVKRDFTQERIWDALASEYLNLLRAKRLPVPEARMPCSDGREESAVHFR